MSGPTDRPEASGRPVPAVPPVSASMPAGPSGLLVVDKPAGWTSHDVVARVRRLAGTRKVGHAGTLDPMATGVLVLGLGSGTRLLTYLVGSDKTYAATIRLGQSTVTDDAEGDVVAVADTSGVRDQDIADAVRQLTGDIHQRPSAVSAIKVGGRRSYARVRAGEQVELAARPVTVRRFAVLALRRVDVDGQRLVDLDVEVEVSSGTYVRALARDLGTALGVGGHLTALRRAQVGRFGLEAARTLEELASDFDYVPLAAAARACFPARELDEAEVRSLRYGQPISASGPLSASDQEPDQAPDQEPDQEPVAAFGPDGRLVALLTDRGPDARSLFVIPLDPAPHS
jgi:tRNA pseudouridine55 synthase